MAHSELIASLANDPMLHPLCAGIGLRSPGRDAAGCGATLDDACGDPAARDYQAGAIKNGRAEIVSIE